MAYLTKAEQEVLSLARSVIRDLDMSYAGRDLAVNPRAICRRLSEMLGEEYDFDKGDVTQTTPTSSEVWKVVTGVVMPDLRHTLNDLAAAGYHMNKIECIPDVYWLVIAFNPVLQGQSAGMQAMADLITKGLDLSALGIKAPA